jgi:Flp pilus assembly pilin Flp
VIERLRVPSSALWHDRSGATVIEYVLIAVLISIVAIAGMGAIGTWLSSTFTGLASDL